MRMTASIFAIGILLSGACATEAAPVAVRAPTNIPAQQLGTALKSFAKDRKIHVVFRSEVVEKLMTRGAVGELTSEEALTRLLAGTPLTYKYLDETTVTIVPAGDAGRNTTSAAAPAEQMRLASLSAEEQKAQETREADEGRQVVVKDTKVRPAASPNMDTVTRTMDDVQPYYIYDSETIQRSGAVTVEQFIKERVTMNTVIMTNSQGQGAGSRLSSTSGNAPNDTSVDLRGLGSGLTLVLINGRRAGDRNFQNYGQKLNEIPASMIDRIEVLPTSASGIYGASAVGGVINIVLKRDHVGGTAAVNFDQSEGSDDLKRSASVSYGFGLEGGRTRISTSLNWTDADVMVLGDRADLYYKSIARITENYPQFFALSSNQILQGSVVNIMPSTSTVTQLNFLDFTPLGGRITHIPLGTTSATLRSAMIGARGVWNTELPDTSQPMGLRRPMNGGTSNQSFGFSVQRQMFPWLDMVLDLRHNESETDTLRPSTPSSLVIRGQWVRPPSCPPASTSQFCNANTPASPFNPFRESVRISFPINHDLPMVGGGTTSMGSLTADVRLPFGWTAMLDYAHTRTEWTSLGTSFDSNLLTNQINAGTFNPFVDATALAAHNWGQYAYISDNQAIKGSSDQFSARFSGPFLKLPWGAPRLNVAVDRLISTSPAYSQRALLAPSSTLQPEMTYFFERQTITSAAYAETLLPLVREGAIPGIHGLEIQLAARVNRSVQDTGTTTASYDLNGDFLYYNGRTRDGQPYSEATDYTSKNYTFGFTYRPVQEVLVRVSRATAFIPPTAEQLAPQGPIQDSDYQYGWMFFDPIDQPFGRPVGYASGPYADQVLVLAAGNPDLVPQNSKSFNAGVVFQPEGRFKGLRLNMEYYKIDQQDTISTLGVQWFLDNADVFPERIVRDADTGQVIQVDNTPMNLFKRATEGMDFRMDYSRQLPLGYLNLSVAQTRIKNLLTQNEVNGPLIERLGFPSEGGAAQDKSSLNLGWEHKRLMFGWNTTHFGAYKIYGAAGGPSSLAFAGGGVYQANLGVLPQGSDTVPQQLFHDLTVGYRTDESSSAAGLAGFFQGMSLRFGVRNIFATEPKLDVTYSGNFYLSPYGGTRLRSFWFNAQKSF